MLQHARYIATQEERDLAEALLQEPGLRGPCNVYTITHQLERAPQLAQLAEAIRAGFNFKDKYSYDWRLIYGVVGRAQGTIAAEFGVTELTLADVATRLSTPEKGRRTLLTTFVGAAEDVRVAPLESMFGNLDDADDVKNEWRKAALRAGVTVIGPAGTILRDQVPWNTSTQTRLWPGTDWFRAEGTMVCKICNRAGDPHATNARSG